MSWRRQRRWVRGAGLFGALGLVLFHGWLLVQRVGDGTVLDPVVAGKWLLTLLLLTGLFRLHRAGRSLVNGRLPLTIWVLVLLLHFVAGGASVASLTTGQLLLVLPASSLVSVAVALSLLRRRSPRARRAAKRTRWADDGKRRSLRGHSTHVSARAPPQILSFT